jgi:hypothetical protein
VAIGLGIYISHQDQLYVKGQELETVGIDAAQVGGDQRLRHQLSLGVRHLGRE